jgi:hypothetical protein
MAAATEAGRIATATGVDRIAAATEAGRIAAAPKLAVAVAARALLITRWLLPWGATAQKLAVAACSLVDRPIAAAMEAGPSAAACSLVDNLTAAAMEADPGAAVRCHTVGSSCLTVL